MVPCLFARDHVCVAVILSGVRLIVSFIIIHGMCNATGIVFKETGEVCEER